MEEQKDLLKNQNLNLLNQLEHLKEENKFILISSKEQSDEIDKLKNMIDSIKDQINFQSEFNKLSPLIKSVVNDEIRNLNRSKNGRRYDEKTKMFCLYIYLTSPKTYKVLKTIFNWPSKQTLKLLIDDNFSKCGLHQSILMFLQNCCLDSTERQCMLLLDEVYLKPALTYDHSKGEIDGKTNLGNLVCDNGAAKTALVFMLVTMNKKVKIPLCFYFSRSSTKGSDLYKLIIDIISQLYQVNIRIHVIVCDNATTNQNLAKTLKISIDQPYFDLKIDEISLRIFWIFDVPHLFKAIRNNFLNYPIKFTFNDVTYIAQWAHICTVFHIDRKNNISLIPKITEKHVNPQSSHKMKVKYATQIFSNSLSCAMKSMIENKNITELDERANGTQILISILNNLFDLLNNKDTCEQKQLRENSTSWLQLINYFKIISTFEFVTNNDLALSKIVCFHNLKITIASLLNLTLFMKQQYDFNFILTGRFNQDSLENFFSIMRRESDENGHLRPETFRRIFSVLIHTKFFSRYISNKSNCDDDGNSYLYPALKPKKKIYNRRYRFECSDIEGINDLSDLIESLINNNQENIDVCTYISGFLLKKLKTEICEDCFLKLQATDFNQPNLKFVILKQFSNCNLYKPSLKFSLFIKSCIELFFELIEVLMFEKKLRDIMCSLIMFNVDFSQIEPHCQSIIVERSICILFVILIKKFLKDYNQKLTNSYNKTRTCIMYKK